MSNDERNPNDKCRNANEARVSRGFPPYSAENKVQFFCFLPQNTSFCFEVGLGGGNHPQKEFCFSRFLPAGADLMSEIVFRNTIIGFAIISADASACSDQLVYQSIIYRVLRNLL